MDKFEYHLKKLEQVSNLLENDSNIGNDVRDAYYSFLSYHRVIGTSAEYDYVADSNDKMFSGMSERYNENFRFIFGILIILLVSSLALLVYQNILIRVTVFALISILIIISAFENRKYRSYKKKILDKYFVYKSIELFDILLKYEHYVNMYYRFFIEIDGKDYDLIGYNEYFEFYYMYGMKSKAKAIHIKDLDE